jgi:hypothetical protein
MLLRLIEGDYLLQMLPRQPRLSLHTERLPQWAMRFYQQHRGLLRAGQGEKLLGKRTRRLYLCPDVRRPPQPKEDREKLRCISQLLT